MSQTSYSVATPADSADDHAAMTFMTRQLLAKMQTVTLVKVLACTNAGGVTAVGTVDVQPLVTQLAGDGTATLYAPLFKLPYFRLQGGANALILDPQVGDIGMAGFCSRDISAVKKTKAQANPGSLRKYDFADGLYVGGFLNGTPSQYVQFAAGINVGAAMVATSGNLSAGTGATGSFTTPTGQTVTVQNGIIVDIL
jgi:hypothetical protein